MAASGQVTSPPHTPPAPLPYASFQLRIVAAVLDLIVVASGFLLFAAAAALQVLIRTDWGASDISDNQTWTAGIIIVSFFVVLPLFFAALWAWRGQSVGQMAVRIIVTDRDGYRLSFRRALLRTVLWPLSVIPLGLGLATIFFDDESRALHDMLAGTVVREYP